MLILITLLIFCIIAILLYRLLSITVLKDEKQQSRLQSLNMLTEEYDDVNHELRKPLKERLIAPLRSDIAKKMTKITPQAVLRFTDSRLAAAGGFFKMQAEQFLIFVMGLAVVMTSFAYLLTGIIPSLQAKSGIFIVAVFAFSIIFPFLRLRQKAVERHNTIQRSLPEVLDLLTISVEAGLGFDGALDKVVEKMRGPLVDEFSRALQEVRMGVPRKQALYAMGERCGVDDLSIFISSLVQSEQLGVSISHVMRIQSEGMRQKRKQRAREKAMKAPVKMLLPLVLLVFPAIFVVLLGPAMIKIIGMFVKR